MLDSKLNDFLIDCKQKTNTLSKEISSLKLENVELEKLSSTHEEENYSLQITKNKMQLQYEQVKEINKAILNDTETTNEKLTKAKNDFCNITKAYQLQRSNINKSELELKERLEKLENDKKNRIRDCKNTLQLYNDKIESLKKEIQRREAINTAVRLELLDRELKDTHRMTNIMDENRKFSRIS